MTFREWWEFNKSVCRCGDAIITVMRKESYASEDVILKALVKIEDVVNLFPNYKLISFSVKEIPHETLGTYTTIGFLLWPNEKNR